MIAAPATLRGAFYGRFSDEMQNASSTDDQLREGHSTAEKIGAALGENHVYLDPATRAGAWLSRDRWAAMCRAAERREFDVIIVENLTRAAREYWRGAREMEAFARNGIKLADGLMGLIDLNTPHGQMYVSMCLQMAEGETMFKRQMSRRGHRAKARAGYSTGGRPPVGLMRESIFHESKVDEDGRPVRIGVRWAPSEDATEIACVRRIFELVDTGVSRHRIAKMPEIEEVLLSRRSTRKLVRPQIQPASITAILRNEIYTGQRIWGKHGRTGDKDERSGRKRNVRQPDQERVVVDGFTEPIIERELWERVQKRLDESAERWHAQRKAGAGANVGRGGTKKRYLLTGLMKCAGCGFAMVVNSGGKNRPAYHCATRKRGKDACANKIYVPREPLEAKVHQVVEMVIKDPKRLAELVCEHNRRVNDLNAGQLEAIKAMQTKRERLDQERSRYVKAVALVGEGEIPELVAEIELRKKQIAELDGKVAAARANLQPALLARTMRDVESGDAPLLTGDPIEDRAFLHEVIEKILVYADGSIVVRWQGSLFVGTQAAFPVPRRTPTPDAGEYPVTDQTDELMAWWAQSPQGLAEQRQLVRSFAERVVGEDGLPEMLATWGQRPLDAGAVQDCLSDPTGTFSKVHPSIAVSFPALRAA